MNALEIYQQYNRNQPKSKSNFEKAFDRSLDTSIDLMSQVLVGSLSSLEGVYDTGLTGLAWASGLISKKAKESLTNEIKKNYTSVIDEHLKKYYEDSYLYDLGYAGELIRQTGQGVGQMLPALGVAGLSSGLGATPYISRVLSQATFFAGATGRGVQDSLNEGATFGQATAYGLMSGSVELATERIFTGSTGNIFGRGMVNGTLARVSSSTLWRLAKEAAGEAFEEALAEFVNPLLKRATYDKNAGFMTEEHKQAILQSAIVGGLTSIAYGQTFGRIRTAQSKDLEDVGELHDLQKKQNVLVSRGKSDVKFDELVMKKKDGISKKLIEMEAKERAEYIKKNQLGNYFNEDGTVISNQENTESMTAQAKNSKIPGVNVATEINDEQKQTINLATKMNQKVVIADIDPISNGRGRKKTIVNGYYDVDTQTIVINKNAKNSAQTVFVHELTHKLEGTKEYAKLGEFIMRKANSNKVLNQMMLEMGITQENIEQMYKKQTKDLSEKQADYVIATEFMARATSEVLFTDEASIQEIANTDRSLASKIYNYIKTTLEKMTKKVTFDDWETKGMSKEDIKNASNEMRVFLNTIKTAEQLYRNALENENGGVKISEINDGIKRYSVEDLRKESIRKALAGELSSGETVHLGFTPELLVKLGFTQRPMSITVKHLKESTDGTKHNIPLEYYESLFNGSLNDPTFIIKKDSVFIFGTNDLLDGGHPVIIPIKKDATNAKLNGVIVDVNMVLSVYGKEKLAKYLDVNINNIIYWNKEKASELNTAARLQLSSALNSLANNTIISEYKTNVNNEQSKNKKDNNRFSITKDSNDNVLTKAQQEFFKNSKVRTEDGKLVVVYHGSDNYGFTELVDSKNKDATVMFFTDNPKIAKTYTAKDEHIYKGYLNIKNPFIVDAQGDAWKYILNPFTQEHYNKAIKSGSNRVWQDGKPDSNWENEYMTTAEVVNNIIMIGEYDGVFFRNIVDPGKYNDLKKYSDMVEGGFNSNVYVLLDSSNQFKQQDNLNPTENDDIRYSLDSEGNELTSGQDRFFKDSQIRDNNGNLLVLFHGTPFNRFNVFKGDMFFFSTSKSYAENYAQEKSFAQGLDATAKIYQVYLNIKKLFDSRNEKHVKELIDKINVENMKYGFANKTMSKKEWVDAILGNYVSKPSWTKDQIQNAQFGKVIGDDKYGYNNDLFIGVDKDNNVVHTNGGYLTEYVRHTTPEQRERLLNGEDVEVKLVKGRWSVEEYTRLYGEEPSKYDYKSEIIKPHKSTQKDEYFTGVDNWTSIELSYDAETKKGLIDHMKELGFDGIKMFENSQENYVAFKPNQIKEITNTNPTKDKDIRYSITDDSLVKKYPNLNLNQDISKLDGVPAIRLIDGSVLPFDSNHIPFIRENNIDVDDIESGGWIGNGIYNSSAQSDTSRYVEREQARRRVQKLKDVRYMLVGEKSEAIGIPKVVYDVTLNKVKKALLKIDPILRDIAVELETGSNANEMAWQRTQKWENVEKIIAVRYPDREIMYAYQAFEEEFEIDLNSLYDLIETVEFIANIKRKYIQTAGLESILLRLGFISEADLETKLAAAKRMHKAQVAQKNLNVDQIVKETGWLLSKDGNWKYRIDTSDTTFDIKKFIDRMEYFDNSDVSTIDRYLNLEDILKSDNLYKHYPHLRDIKVYAVSNTNDFMGYWDGRRIVIDKDVLHLDNIEKYKNGIEYNKKNQQIYQEIEKYLLNGGSFSEPNHHNSDINYKLKLYVKLNGLDNIPDILNSLKKSLKLIDEGISWNQKQIDRLDNNEDFKKTLIHEVQHAVQSYENWARGGNLDTGYNLISNKLRNDAYIVAEQKGIKNQHDIETFVMSYMIKKKDEAAHEAYSNILGEREAQLAELNIYNKNPLMGEPDYEKSAYAIDENDNLIDDKRMNDDIRFSLETSSDENIAKRTSGKLNNKVYSKADAEKTINNILNEIMVWKDYQGSIDGKTKDEVIRALWLALNSKPEGERAKSAIEIAEYLIENALLEDYYNDVDDKMNFEFITATKKYVGRINLDTIKDDVKYTYGKNTNAFLLWGKRKGKPSVDISVVKDELAEIGIFLDGNNDADVFIDLYNKYKKAQTTIKQEMKNLKSELTKDELSIFKNNVIREVLNAWDKTGKPTQLSQQMTKLQDVIKDLRSQLKDTKHYTYAVNRLIDTIRRVEALEKYSSVEEIPLSKEIVGMIKLLTKVKTWRGNMANSESIRQIFKKYSTSVVTNDGRLIPLYNLYHQQNNNQTFGENNPYSDMINLIANGKGNFTAEDIDMIDKILTNFAHNVSSYDKVFFQGKEQSETELATRAIEETKKTIPIRQGGISETVGRYSRWITSPIWRFDRLSNYNKEGYFAQAYREFHKGVSRQAQFKQMVAKHFETYFKEHRKIVDTWHDETITFGDIKISKGQAISLYLSYQREQAKPHMFNVGTAEGIIRFANEKKAQEHRTQDSVTYGKDSKISEFMILELYSKMNMTDKQFIELAKTFFNGIAKDAKVETDIALFGVSNVTDENYFPIRVSDDVIYHQIGSSDFEFAALFSVYNASFNKNVRKNANNKMVIENVLDIIERHTQQMSAYYGLAIPIKSFNRIWNKKIGNTRLNNEITKVDPDFKKYVNKLLKDIQGAKADLSTFDRVLGKVRGWWARAALGLNPKVLATQFASLFAAGGVGVKYRYLAKGFAKASIGQTDYDKLYEYSPMLYDRAREGNNFDVGLLKQYKGVLGKLDIITNATTAPISKVDSLIVGAVWNAALEQTKSEQYLDYSKEHYQAAAELTEEAVMRTQANWSPLYRPSILRETSSALQMVTMFMSEPLQVFSQMAGSLDRVKVSKELLKKAKEQGIPSEIKKAEKALEEAKASAKHYAVSITVNALFLSLVGMSFKWIKFGDDDEEKWWQVMLDELQGHFIGMLPIFRDMYSISQGYDVSNMYQSGLQNLYDGYETIKNTFDRLFDSKTPYDKKDVYKDMRSLIIGLTQTLGIPLRNVETYTKGIIEKFDESMVYRYEDKFYNQSYSKDLEKALEKGDEKLADTIINLMMDDKHAGIKETRVRSEINRLYHMGYSVMPKAASKTIDVDGEIIELNQRQYKKFQEIYSEADGVVLKMVNSINYARLSDEAKAKAIKIVFDYYHAKAKEELTGESFTGNFGIVAEGVDPNVLAVISAYAKTTTGSTRKAMIMSMMRMQGLNSNQMNLVLAYLGYAVDESKIKMYGNTLSLASDQYQQLLKMAGVK